MDKLIAMSRLFGVPIGELLGVEMHRSDDAPPSGGAAVPDPDDPYRTAEIEDILRRYSMMSERRPLRRSARIGAVILAAALVLLLWRTASLSNEVSYLRRQNSDLEERITSISSDVNSSIGTMTERMEEILRRQNTVTADYGYSVEFIDLASYTTTLGLYAVPRQYEEGMTACFTVTEYGVTQEYPAEYHDGRFTATVTIISDSSPSFSVWFERGGLRETQYLENVYAGEGARWLDISMQNSILELLLGRSIDDPMLDLYLYYEGAPSYPAGENCGEQYAVLAGTALLVNGELFALHTAAPDAGETVFTLDLSPLQAGDEVLVVSGVLDNYGRLFLNGGETWSMYVTPERFLEMSDMYELPDRHSDVYRQVEAAMQARL